MELSKTYWDELMALRARLLIRAQTCRDEKCPGEGAMLAFTNLLLEEDGQVRGAARSRHSEPTWEDARLTLLATLKHAVEILEGEPT